MKITKNLVLRCLFLQCVMATLTFQAVIAEEKLQTSDIQNDLLKASLGSKSSNPAIANKTITETDLEIANKKLAAAEARLLEKANAPAEVINPVLPKNDSPAAAPEVKLQEKDIQAPKAPLDINKVIAAIDRTQPEPNIQPATAAVNAPVSAEQANLTGGQDLEKQLAAVIQRNNDLMKELDDTRNRLMIAETQVERLSSIIDNTGKNKNVASSEAVDADVASSITRSKQIQRQDDAPVDSDMQIAVVTAEKVHLRTGPGKENSPLMAVTKGTRLAVETRNGEWYRVIAPTGARAWVSEDVISFSTADKIKSGSNNQVVGFN
jgi:hypothetical protein